MLARTLGNARSMDRVIPSLEALADLVGDRTDLYVRWSRGPEVDADAQSRDGLTGTPLPGLCANPLAVEDWWKGRSLVHWMARRVYDYRHLGDIRGPGVRPWILEGEECGRGPDNEPLVTCRRFVAWLGDDAVREAERIIDEAGANGGPDEWGSLQRG